MDEHTSTNQPIDPRIEELFRAGVQFGYARTRRHPRMKPFIGGVKSNVEIFNLERVLELFGNALDVLETLGKENATILWVGTKPAAAGAVRRVAESLGHPYVDGRWLGGTLTNFDVIRKRVLHWQDILNKQKMGELERYTKQERALIQKDADRMERAFRGLASLHALPRALFVVDTNEEINAVEEARLKNIPIVAFLNSDCDPAGIAYPVPGNDNARESVECVLKKAEEAYLRGRQYSTNGNN